MLEVFLERKHGTYKDMIKAYKATKKCDAALWVMYDALVFEEMQGLDSLDTWSNTNPDVHAKVGEYFKLIEAQLDTSRRRKDFPIMFSHKFLANHLPATHGAVAYSRTLYDKIQRLSNKIRFPDGFGEDDEYDPVLAKDGFYSWNEYLDYELERISSTDD